MSARSERRGRGMKERDKASSRDERADESGGRVHVFKDRAEGRRRHGSADMGLHVSVQRSWGIVQHADGRMGRKCGNFVRQTRVEHVAEGFVGAVHGPVLEGLYRS